MNSTIKDIPRLSVSNLISIFHKKEGDAYVPGCLVAKRCSDDARESDHQFSEPFSLNAFVMFLCESGSLKITSNSKKYLLHKNDFYINFPGQIMHAYDDDNCVVQIIVLDLDFIRDKNLDIKPVANKLIDIKNTQCMKLTAKAAKELTDIEVAIADEINNNDRDEASNDIIRCLLAALFFKIGRSIEKNVPEKQVNQEVFDKNAGYFKEFMILLGKYYKQERSVSFYADKMRLSPKYFTTLIKRASGQTAAEWINQYVILEAKNLLKYSTMNIQEIAYSLNFANQSFFGKYFKNHTGITPSKYKKSL